MKKNLFLLLALCSSLVWAQDYKKSFAKNMCECVYNLNTENISKKELTTQFGLCAFKEAAPFKKEIKKEYNIDLDNDIINEEKMKDFGVKSGMMMMTECPDVFMKIMGNEKSEEEADQLLISGTISKIEKGNFIVFHIVGENKNLTKLYWISPIESNLDLPNEYPSILNKKVTVSYYTSEIFDPKINDYKNMNIISGLKTEE